MYASDKTACVWFLFIPPWQLEVPDDAAEAIKHSTSVLHVLNNQVEVVEMWVIHLF